MSALGENCFRVDGPGKLCGWAQFTADIEMPGMAYAKALRSSYAHARLLRVDASRAVKLPGVVAILTRDDLKGMNSHFGPVVKDQPVVAVERIEVEYEPLPAVFDLQDAMKPDAPVIHADRVKAQSYPAKSGFRLETGGN